MLTIEHAATPDLIHAVIERHRAAWEAYQVAPEDISHPETVAADQETYDALTALLSTACSSRFGALALLGHLQWWLAEEEPNAGAFGDNWHAARARAGDLALFLGAPMTPVMLEPGPSAMPLGANAAGIVARMVLNDRRTSRMGCV